MRSWFAVVFLITTVLYLASTCARADDLSLFGWSRHLNTDQRHNERNWGLGYTHAASAVSVAVYRNSEWRTSVAVTRTVFAARLTDRLAFFIPVGGVTGYKLPVMPLALPVFSYRASDRVAVDALLVPPVGRRMGLAAVSLRFRL